MIMMMMLTMMVMEDHSSRQCNCKSTGCNSDFESAENIVCFKCNSADGIECDADHHGEEVKCFFFIKKIIINKKKVKCWHPDNRGCYIGESELKKMVMMVMVMVMMMTMMMMESESESDQVLAPREQGMLHRGK